ncbi:hypothetical protein M405DRAFT_216343 [Rhizopogon salebrosus TDB-379]|nr:hypothetical protein M405DRAFT_216343 [Rhizopogon salebrosus TDB-379]
MYVLITPRRKSCATLSTRSLKVGQTREKVTSALTAPIQASSSSKVDPSSHGYPAHAIHRYKDRQGYHHNLPLDMVVNPCKSPERIGPAPAFGLEHTWHLGQVFGQDMLSL